jgi:transposase
MRGNEQVQEEIFSYITPAQRIPQTHPLRPIRKMVDAALEDLSQEFAAMYSGTGRPSVPPEQLLRALLVQLLYTVRSERMLMEQLNYNLLFRWFVGLTMDDEVWDATVFTKNRDRLMEADVARLFFEKVLEQARQNHLLSNEHFTVDGTLIEAWAGQKSFQKKTDKKKRGGPDGPSNPTVDFRGEKRRNDTHESKTDPDARLFRKGRNLTSYLCYMGHVLMDNRHGLAADAMVTIAGGSAERDAAQTMLKRRKRKSLVTLGADKGYDTRGFIASVRQLRVTPHVAQNVERLGGTAIDARTVRHAGYTISQNKRKRVEEIFGWMKTVATMRKTRHRGKTKVDWIFTYAAAAYNLIRMRNILAEPT